MRAVSYFAEIDKLNAQIFGSAYATLEKMKRV